MNSRWPLKSAHFWVSAPFFYFLLPFVTAIIGYDSGWVHVSPYWKLLAAVLLVLLLTLALLKRQNRLGKTMFLVSFLLMVFCFGISRMQDLDIRTKPDWYAQHLESGQPSLVKIIGNPAEKERIWRMQVQLLRSSDGTTKQLSGDAYLNIYKSDTPFVFKAGDEVLVPGGWQDLTNSNNPFEVDFAAMNHRRNIYQQQFVSISNVRHYRREENTQKSILDHAQGYCGRQLKRYVKDPATFGLLQAMLLGDESAFDPSLRQAYSETGVIHIVSISGSHVGVLFAMISLLLSGIKGRKGSWVRFVIGLFVIWFYVLMAGAPPSAMRAALMFSVLAVGTAFSKEAQPLNTLFAAAVALLCANPMWLFSVGFQLSFSAVLSLILFYRPIYQIWPQTNKILRWLWSGVSASIAAELLTAPLVMYYFHNFPLFFMISNLLAAGLLGFFALLGGMLVILLGVIPPLASAMAWCITFLVSLFNKIITVIQSWNPVSFKYIQLAAWEMLLLYIAIAAFAVFLMKKLKSGLWVGMSACVCLLVVLCAQKIRIQKQERLVVYNVSRHNIVERIKGNHYQTILSDSSRSEEFAARQAHIGWGAWKQLPSDAAEYFFIKGKRVLLLKDAAYSRNTTSFPVDILVIACSLKELRPQQIKLAFNPQKVVVGGNQQRWQVAKWETECAALGLPFHPVSTKGAFIME